MTLTEIPGRGPASGAVGRRKNGAAPYDAVRSGTSTTTPTTGARAKSPATTTLRSSTAEPVTAHPEAVDAIGPGDGIGWYITRSALTMLALLCLSLVVNLVVLSHVQQRSTQQRLRDQVRLELANGTAPVQAVDPTTRQLLPDGAPVGIIRIPDLAVDQVISFGSTSDDLMAGPGLRRDSVFPGQRGTGVLLARASGYGTPFSDIGQLAPGANFTITTGQGVQQFSVVAVRRAGDPLAPPSPSGSRVTLITAGGSAFLPKGLIRVDADLVGTAQPTPPHALTVADLRPSEQAMAGDPSDLTYLVFALQALLLAVLGAVIAWRRWGHLQAWIVFGPITMLASLWVADNVTVLLPNLL